MPSGNPLLLMVLIAFNVIFGLLWTNYTTSTCSVDYPEFPEIAITETGTLDFLSVIAYPFSIMGYLLSLFFASLVPAACTGIPSWIGLVVMTPVNIGIFWIIFPYIADLLAQIGQAIAQLIPG